MPLVVLMGFALGCARQTGLPHDDSAVSTDAQAVPFDHESHPGGNPSNEFPVTAAGKLHEGTPIAIRLLTPVSSALSSTGDTFAGTLDEPIVIEGQTAVPRGSAVTGRILAAKSAGGIRDPGYLRIALVSLALDGKRVAIETSSLFVKGGPHGQRDRGQANANTAEVSGRNEVGFDAERRLTFRLAQAVDLH
jgi:hypothetical protein